MKIIDRVFSELEKSGKRPVELANFLGINKSVISNWKTRSTNPPADLIVPICEFLEVDTSYLLTGRTTFKNSIRSSQSIYTAKEHDLINMFRSLDKEDKEELFNMADFKYQRAIKRGTATSISSTDTDGIA